MGRGLRPQGQAVHRARLEVDEADALDMENKKAARHWLAPRAELKLQPARRLRPRPVKLAEPWWPGGGLQAVEPVERERSDLPAVGWLCMLPREEPSPLIPRSSKRGMESKARAPRRTQLVPALRPYKCGPPPVYPNPGPRLDSEELAKPIPKPAVPRRNSLLQAGIVSPAAVRRPRQVKDDPEEADAEPESAPEGRDSDSEGEVVVTARNRMGQLRRALQQMGSMSSVVSSIKTKPNPLLERRRSSCDFSNLLPIAMDESEELAEKEPGRSRALKMLLRMINLEVKTRQAHRRENLLRAVLDAFQCQVQVARHVRGTFTEQEAEAVHEAFERCTGPRAELGSENSLFWCLADLGLTGSSVNEKRRVWEQIALAFGNPMEPQVEEEAASDKLQALMRKEGEGICEQDLILYVLPAVRRVLEEHCEEELSQKVQRLDSDIDVNRMPISLCARAARLLGVESNFFLQVAQETFEGTTRMPATLSLELAGRALQRCRERVARRLRRKELQVKQELYLTEAKVMSSRPKLLELHLRFQAYCEPEKTEGLKVMSEESVKRLLKEMGKLPSSQGPDLGAFLQSDINIVGPRFTFARLWRLLEEQRKAALSWVQEELEAAFAHGRRGATLSPAAAAQALAQLNLNPARREDQNDITAMLAEAVGLCRHGGLNFKSFQDLCMEVQDRLLLLNYEAGFECGVVMGLGEAQMLTFWEAFHTLELPQDALIRGITTSPGKDLDSGSDEEGPSKSVVYLSDATMPTMASSLMSYIAAHAPQPMVKPTSGRFLCGRLAERWTISELKRALRLLRLPTDYVQSLEDEELVPVLAQQLGLENVKELHGIGEALTLGTPEELYRKAQALGFARAQQLGWEAIRAQEQAPDLARLAE